MSETRVLLVEDDPDVVNLLLKSLEPDYQVKSAGTLEDAKTDLKSFGPDIVLLDVELPDGESFNLVDEIKSIELDKRPDFFFLTARSELPEQIMGLNLGAEDYITKPFEPILVKTKIDNRVKRRNTNRLTASEFKVGGLEVSLAEQKCLLVLGGTKRQIDLTSIEFKLLVKFMKAPGQAFSRDLLITSAWGDTVHITERTVDTHISHLRKKISDSKCSVEGVRGVGYKLLVEN